MSNPIKHCVTNRNSMKNLGLGKKHVYTMYKRYKKNGWIYVQTPNTVRYSELAGTVVFLSKWANFREKPNMSMGWESGFTISRGVDRTKTKYRVRAGFILEAQARQFWWIVYHFSYRIRFLTKTWFDDILLPSERKIGNGIQRRIFISIVCRNVCML